jgi:uncharacterized protein (DUF1501 family)
MTTLHRREWLRLSTAGMCGLAASSWLPALAADAARHPQRKRACILLWMSGGPSHIDTFDPKPGHANNGPFKPRQTRSPGLLIGEHLPQLAERSDQLAVVRSMSTKEGDHGRATYQVKTGNLPQGAIEFPTFGALVSKELADPASALPGFVSIAPQRFLSQAAFAPGFLGPQFAPLIVGENASARQPGNADQLLRVQDLAPPNGLSLTEADQRIALLRDLESDFLHQRPGVATASHRSAYERATRLMKAEAAKAFDLSDEPAKLRDDYGRNVFGQGCLLARRLVERGVPFVEVTLDNWDTHNENFTAVKGLCATLDPAWATLLRDLQERGLLDTTMVVWMGEFGRTPKINNNTGRDHYPNAWSVVFSGGGIKGGQAVGSTSKDGTTVEQRPVGVPDVLATVCKGLGIDYEKQNMSNVGRPIRIVEKAANPLTEVLA